MEIEYGGRGLEHVSRVEIAHRFNARGYWYSVINWHFHDMPYIQERCETIDKPEWIKEKLLIEKWSLSFDETHQIYSLSPPVISNAQDDPP